MPQPELKRVLLEDPGSQHQLHQSLQKMNRVRSKGLLQWDFLFPLRCVYFYLSRSIEYGGIEFSGNSTSIAFLFLCLICLKIGHIMIVE